MYRLSGFDIALLSIVWFHRPLRSRRQGRRVDFSFHFLLRGQKVKNNGHEGKMLNTVVD
jgi:hypothetical protein